MSGSTLEQTKSPTEVEEEFTLNPELTVEEMADDRLAHLLITAWVTVLKKDQESV